MVASRAQVDCLHLVFIRTPVLSVHCTMQLSRQKKKKVLCKTGLRRLGFNRSAGRDGQSAPFMLAVIASFLKRNAWENQ